MVFQDVEKLYWPLLWLKSGLNFIHIKGSNTLNKYIGTSEKLVSNSLLSDHTLSYYF